MAANLKPVASFEEAEEFHVTATKKGADGSEAIISSFVRGFTRSLAYADGLARAGWFVTVDDSDPTSDSPRHLVLPS